MTSRLDNRTPAVVVSPMPSPSPYHFIKAASALAALQQAAGKVNDAVASPADGALERAPLTAAPNDKQHREAMIEEARVKHYQDQPFSSSAMIGGALGLGLPSVVAAFTDPGAFTRHPGRMLQYSLATGLTGMGAGLGSEALGRVLTRQFGPKFAPSRWHRDQDPHRWNTALRTAPLGVALLAGRTLPAMFSEMNKAGTKQAGGTGYPVSSAGRLNPVDTATPANATFGSRHPDVGNISAAPIVPPARSQGSNWRRPALRTGNDWRTPQQTPPPKAQVGAFEPTVPQSLPANGTPPMPKVAALDQDLRDRIAAANARVAVPSLKEIESGNYQKGHYNWKGLGLTIETAKGQTRSGVNKSTGKPWSVTMKHSYGYIKGTDSAEPGDQMDIFMGDQPESEVVFCVDQNKQDGKTFDEVKCILGCCTSAEAKQLYMDNYSAGWKGFRSITPLTLPQFKSFLTKADLTKPVAGQQFADFHKRAGFADVMEEVKRQLPRFHTPEAAVGAAAGAGTGLAVQLARRLTHKGKRDNAPSLLKGLLVGGGLGAFGANLVGDRARRYFSNLPDPYNYDFDSKWKKIKELGWGGVQQGAIQDQLIKDPDASHSPEANTMRWEMLRRGLNLPTHGTGKDFFKQVGTDTTGSPTLEVADRFFDSKGRMNASGRPAWEQLQPYNLMDSLNKPQNDSVLTKSQLLRGFTMQRRGRTLGLHDKWDFDLHPGEADKFKKLLTAWRQGTQQDSPLDAAEDMSALKALGARWLLDKTIAGNMPTFHQAFAFPDVPTVNPSDERAPWDKGVIPHRVAGAF